MQKELGGTYSVEHRPNLRPREYPGCAGIHKEERAEQHEQGPEEVGQSSDGQRGRVPLQNRGLQGR